MSANGRYLQSSKRFEEFDDPEDPLVADHKTMQMLKDLDLLNDDDEDNEKPESFLRDRSREFDKRPEQNHHAQADYSGKRRKLRIISKDTDDDFLNTLQLDHHLKEKEQRLKAEREKIELEKIEKEAAERKAREDKRKAALEAEQRERDKLRRLRDGKQLHGPVRPKINLIIPKGFESKKSFASQFRVLENLGQGGSSIVRKVICLRDGKVCAVKSCKSNDPSSISYIKKELKILKMLAHPNIIKTYGIFESTSNVGLAHPDSPGTEVLQRREHGEAVQAQRPAVGERSQVLHADSREDHQLLP